MAKKKNKQSAPFLQFLVGIVALVAILLGSFFYFNPGKVNFVGSAADREKGVNLRLVFVGDIMLSRNIGSLMVENNDWGYPFEHVKDFLKKADLTFANFENPVSTRGENVGSIYSFRVDPRVLQGMTDSGIDVVSIANNHIWDWGPEAFADTLTLLPASDITPVGGGNDYATVHTPVVKDVKGTKIAFLAYTRLVPGFLSRTDSVPAVAYPTIEQIALDVDVAKTMADLVVVSFHWGNEYETKHNAEQELWAHAAIDAGANLVVGHHPHVMQEVERYNDGYIAYSLGNFVFDQNFSEDTSKGLVLEVLVDDKKIQEVKQHIVTFNKTYQPSL
ncbi:MAG: CapA family protein [Patescibacteria group bacterium]